MHLGQQGYRVVEADDGETGLELALREKPDLILLDLMLPGRDGIDVCRMLRNREETRRLPLVMLTARSTEADKVLGLEMGADDYLVKPFSPRELVARVRAHLRRTYASDRATTARQVWERGWLRVDLDNYEVFVDGEPVRLSLREFELLKFFLEYPDRAFSRLEILDLVWGDETHVEPRTVDVHISRLRHRIDRGSDDGALIRTVRGVGYKFKPDALDRA